MPKTHQASNSMYTTHITITYVFTSLHSHYQKTPHTSTSISRPHTPVNADIRVASMVYSQAYCPGHGHGHGHGHGYGHGHGHGHGHGYGHGHGHGHGAFVWQQRVTSDTYSQDTPQSGKAMYRSGVYGIVYLEEQQDLHELQYIYIYIYIYVYMVCCVHETVCVFVYMYVYMYVHTYIYTCIHTYVCAFTQMTTMQHTHV